MKFLHLNTASAFTSDYKLFGYQTCQSDWEPAQATPIELWDKHCHSGLEAFRSNLDLGYRSRSFSIWICREDTDSGYFCAITMTGLASEARKDFMGRIIYDSLSLININDNNSPRLDARSFASEQANIARNALEAFFDKNWSLDGAANLDSFNKDVFAFSDIDRVHSLFAERREFDLRTGLAKKAGVPHQLALKLLNRLDIGFSTEETLSRRATESNRHRPKGDLLRGKIDERIENMAETAEEIKDEIEDTVTCILGEKRSQMLFRPFRVMEDFLKKGPFTQARKPPQSPKGTTEESKPSSSCIRISCNNRPSMDLARQLQEGLFSIWESNPSVAIGLSFASPETGPASGGIDAHAQGPAIIIMSP